MMHLYIKWLADRLLLRLMLSPLLLCHVTTLFIGTHVELGYGGYINLFLLQSILIVKCMIQREVHADVI